MQVLGNGVFLDVLVAQDTLLKAMIAGLLPAGRRSLAFGLFYAGYGVGWLLGSVTTRLCCGVVVSVTSE